MNDKLIKAVRLGMQTAVIYTAMDVAKVTLKKVGKAMHDHKIKKGLENEEA